MDRLRAMEVFVTVVNAGSLSAAARQLGIGQPAVSKTVAQLEAHLQTKLLLRSTRGLKPTDAGELLFQQLSGALERIDEAEQLVRGEASSFSGRLRVSAAVTFSRLNLIPRLGEFLEAHPQLTLDLLLEDRSTALIEEGIDVCLRMGALSDSSLIARKLGQQPRWLMASPAYLQRHGTPQHPQELAEHEFIVLNLNDPRQNWTFTRGDEEVNQAVSGRLRITAAEGVRSAIMAGLGLGIGGPWMFQQALARGEVVRVLPDWQLPALDLWALFPGGRRIARKTQAFTDFVANLVREQNQALEQK